MIKVTIQLKFPDLETIKKCPRHPNPNDPEDYKVYEWDIFELADLPIYCRVVYNEDDNGLLYLDLMCDGYCDRIAPKGFNETYELTGADYQKLQDTANKLVNNIIDDILFTNDTLALNWYSAD